jgi:hypothetical protein
MPRACVLAQPGDWIKDTGPPPYELLLAALGAQGLLLRESVRVEGR